MVLAIFCFIFEGPKKKYISIQTSPEKTINKSQFIPDDLLDITIDGKMEEDSWLKSQIIYSFYTSNRELDNGNKYW